MTTIEAMAMADEKAENIELMEGDDGNKKKRLLSASVTSFGKRISSSGVGGSSSTTMKCCQAENCTADLSSAKQYHRRHKVCEYHSKAQVVVVGGIRQRFCQQCSRFHELSEFDETKRSCRRRLAGHNERRRKNFGAESHTRSASQIKDVCGQVDERGRTQINVQETATYKHFQFS